MNNKTCGECKYLNRELAFCRACGTKWIKDTDGASCKYFEKKTPPTNREVFFSKRSNEELAGDYTRFCDENGRWLADLCGTWHNAKHEALQANLNWLNAPADCVKQNGNHDTQTYLCEADYTESEGENE